MCKRGAGFLTTNVALNVSVLGEWSSGNGMWGYGLDLAGSGHGQGQGVGTCECGNEPSGSIKCGEFLD